MQAQRPQINWLLQTQTPRLMVYNVAFKLVIYYLYFYYYFYIVLLSTLLLCFTNTNYIIIIIIIIYEQVKIFVIYTVIT